ncbi:hypothetical protein [Streptomyces sp. NRRL S-1448]|uniref:hypothetical protein n=1 Tax=Streptomyces sp. NRRL S-1448 TaxID=1463883 RepID=UPI0004C073BA|nr:hypothetical protein [Streptomyces sp. NRRL S-1448]
MGIGFALAYMVIGSVILFDCGGFIRRWCARVQRRAAERHREMLWRNGLMETPYVPTVNARPGCLRAMGIPIVVVGCLLLMVKLG